MAGKILLLISIMMLMLSAGCNNPNGESVVSANHTPLLKPPGAFKFSQIVAANGNVTFQWQPSARVASYKIYMGTTENDISTPVDVTSCTLSSRSCALTGLIPSTLYYFKIEAINTAGTTVISPLGSALSVDAFDISSSSAGDGQISLSWGASTRATKYNIVYGTSSGSYTSTASNVTSPYTLTGLNNGKTYYLKVVASNANNGYVLSTSEASEKPLGLPTVPSGVTALAQPSHIELDWTSVPGADSYQIYRGTSSGSLTQLASNVVANNYSDTSIVDGTTYYYAIKAYNGLISPLSSEVSGKSIPAFNMTSLSAAPSANQLTVAWPTVAGADSFDVQYGTTPSSMIFSATNVTSPYVLTGLTGGTTYYVKVLAKNAVGSGTTQTSTNQLQAAPIATIAAPTGLTAAATPGSVTLTWSAVTGSSSYEILRSSTSGGPYTSLQSGIGATSFTDSSVVNGTSYYYVARSYNGYSSVNSAIVAAKPIASFSISSVSSTSSTSLQLSWIAPAGADAFDLVYGTSPSSLTSSVSGISSPYNLTGLSANTTYYLAIRGRNSVGTGTNLLSSQSSQKTSSAAPTSIAVVASPGQTVLSWTAPAGATSFKIYRSTASGSANYNEISNNTSSSPYTDTAVSNGTTYFYAVKASNGTDSAYSSEVSARPIENFNMTSVNIVSATSASLVWPTVTGAATYDLRYGTSSTSLTSTLTGITSPYTVTGLTAGSTYYFSIRAKNTIGGTTYVDSTNTLNQTMSASAPTGVVATSGTGQISLSWNTVATALSYNVYRGTVSGVLTQLASGITSTSYVDSSVSDGTQYFYTIRTFNGTESSNSSQVTGMSIANFALTSVSPTSSTSLTISWPSVLGAQTYDVLYRNNPTGTYTTASNKTSPFILTGLVANTTYYVVVKAKNTIGSGFSVNSSNELSQITPVVAPASLVATLSSGDINLTWGSVTGASSYSIYRSTTSGSFSTPLATGLTSATYADTTTSSGTTYYYVVSAFNGAESANSSQVSIKPIDAFSISSASVASSTSIVLTWPAVTGADSYDVKYGTNPASLTTLATQTSPKTFTGLSANTTYYFVVIAKNAVGSGSSESSAQVSAKTPTAAPGPVSASATPSQIALSWPAVTGATSYNIYRGTSAGARTLLASAATNSYNDGAVSNGTDYFYTVRATNGAESTDSTEVSAKAIGVISISSTSVLSSTSIQINWNSAAGADSYDVKYGTNPASLTTLTGQTSPKTFTGLTTNTTYYFIVVGKNTTGAGTNYSSAQTSATTAFGAPSGLATSGTPGQVALSWNSVSGASQYKIFRGTTSGSLSQLSTSTTNSYTDSTVSDGTVYFYTVRAFNGTDSADSTEVSIKTIAPITITAATVLGPTSIDLTWPSVAGADSYDVKYGTNPASLTTLPSQTSPKSFTTLSANTAYYFVVVAKNTTGTSTSLNSDTVSATTPFAAPTGLIASATPGQVGLNWTAVSGATSYKVYRGTSSGALSLLGSSSTNAYLDTTAVNGTTYFYTVRAYNGLESADSNEVSTQPISNFSLTAASAASASSINLTWGSATGASTYDVQYGTSPGVYLTTVSGVTSPYTLGSLSSGTTYYINIRARNTVGSGTTHDSNELNAKTGLGAPATLSLVGSSTNVAISWSAVSGATNYNVYRGTSSGVYSQLAAAVTATSYTDSTAANGTTYFYVVRSNNGIESVNSTEKSIQTVGSFTLSSVTVNSSSALTVAWGSASGAATYDVIYRPTSVGASTTLTNKTSPFSITGLAAATSYSVSVKASNVVGVGASYTTTETAATTSTAPPSTLTASTTPGNVSLSWSAVTGATGYKVYRGTTTGVYSLLATVAVSPTTYTDSTAVNGTQYFYVVRATNGTESANSSEATATPISSFTISSLSVISSTSLQVSWAATAGAASYDVYYRTSTGSYGAPITGVTSPYTVSGLSPNTTYVFKINAKNAIGSGSSVFTAESSQITPVAAPTSLAAAGGSSTVSLTWVAASGASSYKIYRGTVSGSLTLLASGVSGTTYSDNTVSNGTSYFYAMSSFNGADSAQTTEVSAKPIAAFTISSVNSTSSSSLTVSWSAVAGADSYEIKWGTASNSYGTPVTGVTSAYTISGLSSGTTYFVRVVAKNAVGAGTTVNSSESSAATNSPPMMGGIGDQTIDVDTSGTYTFSLSDANHVLSCSSALSGSSSNTTLLPNSGITFGGSLATGCTITVTPAATQTGTATVTVTATDGVSPVTQTFTLTVNSCTVASIEWVTQPPATTQAGATMATAPKVKLLKSNGSLCTTTTTPVSLTIGTDASTQGDAIVNTGDTATPSGGYATFSSVKVNRAGAGHTFLATQGTVTSDLESSPFTITALTTATTLVFAQQPLSTGASSTLSPTVTVRTADTYGNYVAPATNTTVNLALKNSPSGTTATGASGTSVTASASGGSAGIASFTTFSVSTAGTYFVTASATGYTSINSSAFSILTLVPQNVASVIELVQGPVSLSSTSTTYFEQSGVSLSSNNFNGTGLTYKFQIVATNAGGGNSTVRLRVGTTSYASVIVPGNVSTPSMYTTTFSGTPTTAQNIYRLALRSATGGGTITIYSARIIATATSATKAMIYVPLTSMPETGLTGITTTSTSVSSSMPSPNDQYFPSYTWDLNKFNRIDTAELVVSGLGVNSCVSLWNKTTNTQIGSTELCAASTAVIQRLAISTTLFSTSGELEVRLRSTTGATATLYKAGLMLKMVGLYDVKTIARAIPATTLTTNTNFNKNRFTSFESNFGTSVKNNYFNCRAKANTTGSGSLLVKDYGLDNSSATVAVNTTTPTSTITSSTINLSNQSTYEVLSAGPLATTSGRHMFANYAHTSGSFNVSHCLFELEVAY